jgi:hypothetical protein
LSDDAPIPGSSSAPPGFRVAAGSDIPLYALCAALVLAFHFRLALPGRALVANDFRALFIALRGGLQQTLRAGALPLWQRGIFAGYPILGDIQPQLFNPLTWLTMPLDPARGVTVQSLLELCLCAVGMAFWMRQRGLRRLESVFAAVAFALSLKETVHLHHWTFASSTCAWPWMLAGLDGFAATRKRRFFVLAALASCGSWLGASPQMAYFGGALAGAYSLLLARQAGWRIVLAVPLGVALAAPLLLPVAELSGLGPRGAGITYNFAASWSWTDRSVWAAMVLPRVWGGRPNFNGPLNYWELQGYFGLLPMALALAAPLKRRGLWLFAAVTVLCLWFSFGDHAWLGLHRLAVEVLPGYGGFRNPTRALMLGMFCVAVLAAEGLARLRDQPAARFSALGGLAALSVAVAFWVASPPPRAQLAELRADALVAAAILLVGAALVFRRRALFLLVPLLLVDLAVQTWDSPEVGPAASEGHVLDEILRFTPRAPKPRRVTVLLDWGEGNNATYAAGLEGVTGYGPTPIQRVLTLLHATYTGRIRPPQPLDDDPNFPRLNVDSDLAGLFASPFAVLKGDEPYEKLRLRGTRALPRVYWVGAFEAADDEHVTAALHRAALGNQAVLAEPLDWPSGDPSGPLEAGQIEVHTNHLKATVRAPRDGLAVVLDPFYPGWTARVDGVPAPLVRANFAFEAVPVKAGLHTIELSYFPDRLLPGLGIALLALALLFVLLRKETMRRVDTPGTGGYFPRP